MQIPIKFTYHPDKTTAFKNKKIYHFNFNNSVNIDEVTVNSFGEEWIKFNSFTDEEINNIGKEYFDILELNKFEDAYVLDAGCGSGRWSKFLATKVKFIEAIDPSDAVYSAAQLLSDTNNIRISQVDIENLPFPDNTFDLIISLGVLHHIPDTPKALQKLVNKLKDKGTILIYLYYKLDNKPWYYHLIFNISNQLRKIISKLPSKLKKFICDVIAIIVYLPFKYLALFVKKLFPSKMFYKNIPLYYYMDKSFKVIRNDALDRFGTPLEQRFSKDEITRLLNDTGLVNIVFSKNEPYWHVKAQKK